MVGDDVVGHERQMTPSLHLRLLKRKHPNLSRENSSSTKTPSQGLQRTAGGTYEAGAAPGAQSHIGSGMPGASRAGGGGVIRHAAFNDNTAAPARRAAPPAKSRGVASLPNRAAEVDTTDPSFLQRKEGIVKRLQRNSNTSPVPAKKATNPQGQPASIRPVEELPKNQHSTPDPNNKILLRLHPASRRRTMD